MDVFILGIERSATTWVSKIIEAHPATEVYMEPLSNYISHFSRWPNRLETITNQEEMVDYFESEFKKIKKDKRFFLTKMSDLKSAWKFDFRLANSLFSRFDVKKARNFIELNFHRRNEDFPFKKRNVSQKIIKELRLNFNAGIIPQLNSDAKVIIVVREYAPNILSIIKYVKRGRLKELQDLLDLQGDKNDYLPVLNYWTTSYTRMIEELEKTGTNYILMSHEAILANGEKEIQKLFDFIGLDFDDQVINYFNYSNRNGDGAHNTNRDRQALLNKITKEKKKVDAHLGEYTIDVHPKICELYQLV
jgi:hypothetical protein